MLAEINEKYYTYVEWAKNIQSKPPSYWQSHPILTLIAQGESQHLEFKEILDADTKSGTSNKEVVLATLKTIAAFLNSDGGTLLIGVTDKLAIAGLKKDFNLLGKEHKDTDAFEQKLRSAIKSRIEPFPLNGIDVSFISLPEGIICRVDVQRSKSIVHVDNKDVYVRVGNTSEKIEGKRLTKWIEDRAAGVSTIT